MLKTAFHIIKRTNHTRTMATLPTRKLGKNGPQITALGYGQFTINIETVRPCMMILD